MSTEPWICPRCNRVNAGWLPFCNCHITASVPSMDNEAICHTYTPGTTESFTPIAYMQAYCGNCNKVHLIGTSCEQINFA
jgi:hypothetical protein